MLVKDVAGLVPGACDGRGKGNKFLNDLLDADVLIHVIDVSGETDENGKLTSGKILFKFIYYKYFLQAFNDLRHNC